MYGALFEAELGNSTQGRFDADAALKLAPDRDVRMIGALSLAQAGDTASAEKLATTLDKDFPLDTLIQRYWLPTIRADRLAAEKSGPGDRTAVQVAAPSIWQTPKRLPIPACSQCMCGVRYLALHDGNRAAAEFQKYIDRRGMVRNSPIAMLARLGLARAYTMQGDTPKARPAYQEFLTTWKRRRSRHSDTGIQAKAEYVKLQ